MGEFLHDILEGKAGPAWFLALIAGFSFLLLRMIGRAITRFAEIVGKSWGGVWAQYERLTETYEAMIETLKKDLIAAKAREFELARALAHERARVAVLEIQLGVKEQ